MNFIKVMIFLNIFLSSSVISTDLSCIYSNVDNCNWYRDCLESTFKCENSHDSDLKSTAYALKYGEKECKLYEQNYSKFSSVGAKWVDANRLCLKRKLAEKIYWAEFEHQLDGLESSGLLCKYILYGAFDRDDCYEHPEFPLEPYSSICELNCSDFLVFFDIIKSTFTPFSSEFWGNFLLFISDPANNTNGCLKERFRTCQINWSTYIFGDKFRFKIFKINFMINPLKYRQDQWNSPFEISNYVAKKFQLDKMHYKWTDYWLSYLQYAILITDISSQNNNSLDFHIYSVHFFDEFINNFQNTNNLDYKLEIDSISICTDLLCEQSKDTCLDLDTSSCNWYRECLESKYTCCDNDTWPPSYTDKYLHPYAIPYAERYCLLYDQNYAEFSNNGKKWVDEVRKCLQISLATIINSEEFLSIAEVDGPVCYNIRENGFDSHVPCYLRPSSISPDISICKLDCNDMHVVFKTIRSAFLPFVGEFWQSFLGFLSVQKNCLQQNIRECKIETNLFTILFGEAFKYKFFKVKTVLSKQVDNFKEVSKKIGNYIANKFELDKKNYNWIDFVISDQKNNINGLVEFECAFLLFDISIENNSSLDFEIDSLNFFDELLIEEANIESFSVCDDLLCKDTIQVVGSSDRVAIKKFMFFFLIFISYLKCNNY